jgi:hypothetical protein
MLTKTEIEFCSQIDCSFPYLSPLKWRRAVAIAVNMSPDVAFTVIYELCCPGRGERVSITQRKFIYAHLVKRFNHPLLKQLKLIINAQLNNKNVPVPKAAKGMRQVSKYSNAGTALSICYFSCDDRLGKNENLYKKIVEGWND